MQKFEQRFDKSIVSMQFLVHQFLWIPYRYGKKLQNNLSFIKTF